jgi:hypothetical protein
MTDKRIIHIPSVMEWDSMRFHHATQKDIQFKTYELLISGIFHLIFRLWVAETMESETVEGGVLLYYPSAVYLDFVQISLGKWSFDKTEKMWFDDSLKGTRRSGIPGCCFQSHFSGYNGTAAAKNPWQDWRFWPWCLGLFPIWIIISCLPKSFLSFRLKI